MKLKPPRTRPEFIRYLRDVFDKLEATHACDCFDEINLGNLIEEVSIMACRFGAGHLIDPQCHTMKTREALVVVGRLLAWAEQNPGNYFDSRQAADYIGV